MSPGDLSRGADAGHVLVVDDSRTERLVMQSILRHAGFDVMQAHSSGAAMEVLKGHPIDAIVSDVLLERETAFELISAARAGGLDVPVLLVTSSEKLSLAAEAVRTRAFDYLLKPLDPRALVQSVRVAVGEHRKSATPAGDRVTGTGKAPPETLAMESLPSGLVVVDPMGEVLLVNREAERLLGADRHDLVGRPLDLAERLGELQRAVDLGRDGTFRREERIAEVGSGERRSFIAYMTAPLADAGQALFGGVVLHLSDATRRVQLEQALVQADKLATLGLLASSLAHDINNPMTVLIGGFEMLEEELGGLVPPEVAERFQVMKRASWQCVEIVRHFLTFSRSGPDSSSPAQVRSVLNDVVALVGRQLATHGVYVEHAVQGDLPPVKLPASQLQQVLLNLVVNARDAMPQGGRLSTRCSFDGMSTVSVEIADTGDGIPSEILTRVFEPFFTTKAPGKGTGLGLAICRRILQERGGELAISSVPGRGTTVTVKLPAVERPASKTAAPAVRPSGLSPLGLSVLVVDDEPDTLQLYERILERNGCKAETFRNPVEALEAFEAGRYHLAFLDLRMPGMDGLSLSRRLKAADPALPIVMVSASLMPDSDVLTAGPELHGFMAKPFLSADIRRWLEQIAELARWMEGGPAPLAEKEAAAGPALKRYRVLLADDDPDMCAVLTAGLERSGRFEVETVSDGKAALASAAANLPDAIILDVMMPEMDGLETCRRLKENPLTSRVPVVMNSVRNELADVSHAFQAGASQFLMKPTSFPDLVTELLALLEPKPRGEGGGVRG